MKKLLLLIVSLVVLVACSYANPSKYRISDNDVDNMFISAIEVNLFETIYVSPLSGTAINISYLNAEKSNVVAGVLGIFIGWLGIHRLYSDSPFKVWGIYAGVSLGGICLGVAGSRYIFWGLKYCTYLPSCVGVVGLVDGIIMLTGSEADYNSKWVGSEKMFNW